MPSLVQAEFKPAYAREKSSYLHDALTGPNVPESFAQGKDLSKKSGSDVYAKLHVCGRGSRLRSALARYGLTSAPVASTALG